MYPWGKIKFCYNDYTNLDDIVGDANGFFNFNFNFISLISSWSTLGMEPIFKLRMAKVLWLRIFKF